MDQRPKLPKLPYGQGSYSYRGNKIQYRRRVSLEDGSIASLSVIKDSIRECNKAMDQKITDANRRLSGICIRNHSLAEAMRIWLKTVKQPALKQQSYNRLEKTIENQICPYAVADYQYQRIHPEQLQELINKLNEKNYSKSTIKKAFDALNEFFRYVSKNDHFQNPMVLVNMPISDNINASIKEIAFFDQDDIALFTEECGARWKSSGELRYPYGYALAANIFLGMRIGELLALTWGDIDFERNTIYVCKTTIEEKNPEYDESNPSLMKQLGIHKTRNVVQNSTKKSKNRYVPMNSKAKEYLLIHYDNSIFRQDSDLVISSKNKKIKTIKNISDTIARIEENAGTKTRASGTHILRHTCASLYFRKGVPIETICQILGNTREVCEKTYIHFIEEQLKEAASKIDVIEI